MSQASPTVLDLFRLDGRVALVTGASGGLGAGFACALAEAGADVVLAARRVDALEKTAERVREIGRKALPIATDVVDPAAGEAAAAAAVAEFGRLDILINNAGVSTVSPALREDPEDFRRVIDVNLVAGYQIATACARVMGRGGSIVNVASVLGLVKSVLPQAAYAASKAGLIGLTRDLAHQWTERRGIRVNALAPGFVATDMNAEMPEETLDRFLSTSSLHRLGTQREMDAAMLFLASPASGYVTRRRRNVRALVRLFGPNQDLGNGRGTSDAARPVTSTAAWRGSAIMKNAEGSPRRGRRPRVSDPATAILLAAESCYLRLGIAKTTMDDVAREAGVSRPTVYRHHATRDDLITGVLLARARDLIERARRFIDTRTTIDAKLADGTIFLLDAGRRDPIVVQLSGLQTPETANRKLATDLTAELWAPLLRHAQEAGEVRPDLDVGRFCSWLTFVELILIRRIEQLGTDHPSHRSMLERFVVPGLHHAVPYDRTTLRAG